VPKLPALPGPPVGDARTPGGLGEAVAAVFADDGPLARAVEDYEPREGQRQMAAAVARVISNGGTLLAEAGTGTGKTLAYLVPALLSGERVLISTGTKNLQEQIHTKDLPALGSALGMTISATLMKGRSNYLCLHKWDLYRDAVAGNTGTSGRLIASGDHVLLPVLTDWAAQTSTGDRAELEELPEDLALWKELAADAESCLGTECPQYQECFVTRMRQQAAESDVVIVNHHLLCADAAVRQSAYGEVIPGSPTLVVDEAHQLEEVATQYFGVAFAARRVDDLVRDGERLLAARSLSSDDTNLQRALVRVGDRARSLFSGLAMAHAAGTLASGGARTGGREPEGRVRYSSGTLSEHFEDGMILAGSLEALEATLALARPSNTGHTPVAVEAESASEAVEAAATLARRAGELHRDLRFLMRSDDPDFVYYIEGRGRTLHLRAAPIDVSRIVQSALFERMRATVLTSATLAVDGSFEYVRGRLGVKNASETQVASEFDYATQALLYLPRRMPPPRAPTFAEAAARETTEILKRSNGRAFVLFTSYAVLNAVQRVLEMTLPFPLLVQGTAPRSVLIQRFRTTPNAVLLATASFWQGVDVVGEALSCVIIDKLPFASPGDPVTAARIEAITERGGDPFSEYQVPLAILALQQGLGRLIRHRQDRGVLAVLDPRLRTMGYGRRFLESLPPAPVTHDLETIAGFFG
jgi:ATP-dependent DNA helicase DinG